MQGLRTGRRFGVGVHTDRMFEFVAADEADCRTKTELLFDGIAKRGGQRLGRFEIRFEYDIAALDVSADSLAARGGEYSFQVCHRQTITAADIDTT